VADETSASTAEAEAARQEYLARLEQIAGLQTPSARMMAAGVAHTCDTGCAKGTAAA
jgi:hypothetical protein